MGVCGEKQEEFFFFLFEFISIKYKNKTTSSTLDRLWMSLKHVPKIKKIAKNPKLYL